MKVPLLKYHGSKFSMKSKILELIPDDYIFFRSVFLGGGGVEFSVPHSKKSEVWNDLDGNLANLYSVLKNDYLFKEFKDLLDKTLFSEEEFLKCKNYLDTPLDDVLVSPYRAYCFFVVNRMSRQGFGKNFQTPTKRLRRDMNENVSAWNTIKNEIEEFHKRASYVEIRKMHFKDFIPTYDHRDAFFYLDPPYPRNTRKAGDYAVEMSDSEHQELLDLLTLIEGRFLLHTYPNQLYDDFAKINGFNVVDVVGKKSSSSQKVKPDSIERIIFNYDLNN